MAKKLPLLALLLCFEFVSCQKWNIRIASEDYAKHGWQQTYQANDFRDFVLISVGKNDQGSEIIAIDYYSYFEHSRLRLYGRLKTNNNYDLMLFKFIRDKEIYLNPQNKGKSWKNSGIRKLYQERFFKKLPETIRKKVYQLIRQAEKKYSNNYNR